jgi:hypothetical protein
MTGFPNELTYGEPMPEIGIGGVGNGGGGPDQKEEVNPKKELYPSSGHRNSAPQNGTY